MAIRQDGLIFWKPVNFIAEMQVCHALKQLVRKGGMSFSRISHTRFLSGSVICCEKKIVYSFVEMFCFSTTENVLSGLYSL